ncbi:MAG: NAD-dependent epimerase/dehydratase family protein [Bacteroidota bacterium]
MGKIYISGTSGFVGTNLLQYLILNGLDAEGVNLRKQLSPAIFPNANNATIVHLAGKAHDLKNSASYQEYVDVNFELTKQLFDLFLTSEASKFIFISSVKAVTDQVEGPLTEDHTSHPVTDYGKSKLMAEKYIMAQILPPGKSYYILRPCMIHGPGNKGNLNLLYKLVSKGLPYPLAAFDNRRSFLSIENLNFVIMQIAVRPFFPTGIYNVADDEALSTNEVVKLIAQVSGGKARLWKIKPYLINWLAKLGNLMHLPLTTERLEKLTENYVVSNFKLIKALNVKLPVNAKDGLVKTIKSFR